MDPGNLHLQHQLQPEFTGYYSSLLSSQPTDCSKVSSTTDLNTPGTILNIDSDTYSNYLTGCIPNSRVAWQSDSVNQGLISSCHACNLNPQSAANDLIPAAKTKEESPESYSKLIEMIHPSSNVEESDFLSCKYEHQYSQDIAGGNQWPLSLSSLSSLQHVSDSNDQNFASLQSLSAWSRYNSSHVSPSINISTSDLISSLVSSSLDLNLQAMDLLSTSTSYGGGASSSQSSENSLGHWMHELKDSPSNSCSRTSAVEDGFGRRKRSKNLFAEAKKNRSAPPLKVRKEKLGDRIAALQRLVAPYGKTDTASVLTEAIGYIQFLHDQVQTLSVPYMNKSSTIKPTRRTQHPSEEDRNGQPRRHLRSGGLCLVPLSCVSFFNTCNGGT